MTTILTVWLTSGIAINRAMGAKVYTTMPPVSIGRLSVAEQAVAG
jgi:hypothetical protein